MLMVLRTLGVCRPVGGCVTGCSGCALCCTTELVTLCLDMLTIACLRVCVPQHARRTPWLHLNTCVSQVLLDEESLVQSTAVQFYTHARADQHKHTCLSARGSKRTHTKRTHTTQTRTSTPSACQNTCSFSQAWHCCCVTWALLNAQCSGAVVSVLQQQLSNLHSVQGSTCRDTHTTAHSHGQQLSTCTPSTEPC
jgi:hypothetical protein